MKNRKRITVILTIVFFVGLSVLLYPFVANVWNTRQQNSQVKKYDDVIKNLDLAENLELFAQADEYNSELYALPNRTVDYQKLSEKYDEALDLGKMGMMGYIYIEKLSVNLPIYHGVSSSVLQHGCGHIQGTSLPVGGESTHAVLSAHRGLPSSKLFSDLNKLEIGDKFSITILDKELVYTVDQIKTVLPEDSSDIEIVEGMDYVTLVTCTPYGINTHRLLVRGVRTDTVIDTSGIPIISDAYKIDNIIVAAVFAVPVLVLLVIYVFVKPAKKKDKSEREASDEDIA